MYKGYFLIPIRQTDHWNEQILEHTPVGIIFHAIFAASNNQMGMPFFPKDKSKQCGTRNGFNEDYKVKKVVRRSIFLKVLSS